MNNTAKKTYNHEHIRFIIYLVLIVLVNLVSSTLFFRVDLTQNRSYTLSSLSRDTLGSLQEPLTLKVFLSENLPQPYNNLKQELRDLMEEYSLKGGRNFSYQIYEIDSEGEAMDGQGNSLTELAGKYGIQPVQIQSFDNNEVSLVSVYMGLVILQSDLSKSINTLGFEDNLEYQITKGVADLAARTNALLAMDDKIRCRMVYSGALSSLGEDFRSYPDSIRKVVDDLNRQYYGRLSFELMDPSSSGAPDLSPYKLNRYNIGDNGGGTPVSASLIIEKGGEHSVINLIERGLLGSHLREADMVKESIRNSADHLLGVQKTIGYLSDHGTPSLYGNPYMQQGTSLSNFYRLASRGYDLKPVTLDNLPEGLETLIIAGPEEEFSERELFQIDQFLMRGGSLALFLDPFKTEQPQGQAAYYGGPTYTPLNTGLERLLAAWGIDFKQAYVMDEQSYVSRSQRADGSYQETALPFAPMIDRGAINHDLPMLQNINGLIMLNAAPLVLIEGDGPDRQELFHSSSGAWEISEDINLMPGMIQTAPEDQRQQSILGVWADGGFTSMFKGKPIPSADAVEPGGAADSAEDSSGGTQHLVLGSTREQTAFLEESQGGRLLVVGSSQLLSDSLVDEQGSSNNARFVQGALDSLTGQEALALLRTRGNAYNPIDTDLASGMKTFIKSLNIAGLPILVIITGLLMWFRWNRRKNEIRKIFDREAA